MGYLTYIIYSTLYISFLFRDMERFFTFSLFPYFDTLPLEALCCLFFFDFGVFTELLVDLAGEHRVVVLYLKTY